MSTVEEIKTAIQLLSVEERAEDVVAELCGWADDNWDRQMKADAAAGKFDSLNREADAAHAVGETHPLNDMSPGAVTDFKPGNARLLAALP